jgi:hypothetical protein
MGSRPRPRLGRLWLAGTTAALALYVLTLAPDLVWQDSGDYQLQAARLNLSRPGDAVRVHPWFLVVAHGLGRLPLWNYAYAANLASALGTALAVGNLLVLVRLVTGRTGPAVIGAAAFALGHTVWAHAVMAETYGWAAAFLSAECLCAWAFLARRQARWLLALALVNGLAISNHMLASLSLAVFGVWVLWECRRRRAPWRVVPAGAACWLAGGVLYWIVLWPEWQRTDSLAAVFRSATSGQWGDAVFNLADLPGMLAKTVLYVLLNYPTPLVAGIVVGAVVLAARRDTFSRLLVVLAVVYFLWAARYKVQDQYAFFIPFYVPAGVMIGVAVGRWLRSPASRWRWAAVAAAALLPVGVYAALPRAAPALMAVVEKATHGNPFRRELPYRDSYAYFLQPWKQGYTGARRFAEEALDSLPPGAVLVADSTASPPLVCVQQLEGRRPDVELVADENDLSGAALRDVAERKLRLAQGAPEDQRLYLVSAVPDYVPPWFREHATLRPAGLLWKAEPRPPEGGP